MKLSEMQKAIYQNKIDHQFNVTNIEKEFLALYGEIGKPLTRIGSNKR